MNESVSYGDYYAGVEEAGGQGGLTPTQILAEFSDSTVYFRFSPYYDCVSLSCQYKVSCPLFKCDELASHFHGSKKKSKNYPKISKKIPNNFSKNS